MQFHPSTPNVTVPVASRDFFFFFLLDIYKRGTIWLGFLWIYLSISLCDIPRAVRDLRFEASVSIDGISLKDILDKMKKKKKKKNTEMLPLRGNNYFSSMKCHDWN